MLTKTATPGFAIKMPDGQISVTHVGIDKDSVIQQFVDDFAKDRSFAWNDLVKTGYSCIEVPERIMNNSNTEASSINIKDYRFLDFGASKGGSLKFASTVFGGQGLGVDIDPSKVAALRESGYSGIVADATRLEFEADSVSYVTMMHFLEHLPNPEIAEKIIHSAARVASDFVFIVGPDFEDIAELEQQGLKKHYTDWSGHTWQHKIPEMIDILNKTKLPYTILQINPIMDSNHEAILPINAERNRGPFDPAIDPPKPFIKFKRGMFSVICCVIIKNDKFKVEEIITRGISLRIRAGRNLLAPLY